MRIYRWNSKTLEMVKIHYYKLILGIGIVLLWCFTSFYYGHYLGFKTGKTSQITEKDVVLVYRDTENSGFTKRKFYEYLKEINIKFPELVFAQAIKESGLKSPLFKENHNPFGMKEASKRPNMQNGTQGGYAYYDTWKNSIIDYAMYQSYVGLSKFKTEEEYLLYLTEMNYYDTEHPNNSTYISDLKHIRDNIEDYLKE
jgi:uncharacterized FlgJ-related protein